MIAQGKLQPQAVDVEKGVLGILLTNGDAYAEIIGVITPSTFYLPNHSLIFSAIQQLADSGSPVNIITVTNTLRNNGKIEEAGGAFAITTLATGMESMVNMEAYVKILKEKEILRTLIHTSADIYSSAFKPGTDPFSLIEQQEQALQAISDSLSKTRTQKSWNALLRDIVLDHDAAAQHNNVTGIPSQFNLLNYYIGGYQNGDLIILAARPGSGKTSFAMNEALYFAQHGFPVLVFSLEMAVKQLILRMASSEAELDSTHIRRGKLSENQLIQLNHHIGRLYNLPIYIDDTPSLSIFEIRARARRMKNKNGIKAIFIDYLQLARDDNSDNREQEIANISRGLKAMAKELDVPVIALAQLSRAVEKRGSGATPILSDLRESGSIEQDADVVGFFHRPELFGVKQDEAGNSTEGKAAMIIAKNRNGAVGNFLLQFVAQYTKFINYDTKHPQAGTDEAQRYGDAPF